ncbi:ATPase family AAA domain-containing protein 2-like [Protopterus annectens]|uniref:ATPase family AAA domain-containing protein 2-like n=1 Tax=Protopterus annectens TaxID=7888 RepID=UPI001CFC1400|nr:ATPase family AAA domain-containing protein 2-like [Protopterus annectens]
MAIRLRCDDRTVFIISAYAPQLGCNSEAKSAFLQQWQDLLDKPGQQRRVEMLRIILRRFRRRLSEDLLERLADECSGFSGAEIKLLHAKAILCARQRCDSERSETELSTAKIKRKVTEEDLFMAIKRLVPDCEENRNLYSKPLSSVIKPLLEKTFAKALKALMQLFPSTKDKPVEEENIGKNIMYIW